RLGPAVARTSSRCGALRPRDRARGPGAGVGASDARGDLVEVPVGERDRCRSDPAVDLFRSAGTDDRSGDGRPCEGPCDGDRGYGGAVPLRDRAKRVPEQEVPAEVRLLELGRAPPPVVLGEGPHSLCREAIRQQAGMHRAVADDARAAARAPGDLTLRSAAIDQRERRLKRIDMADRLAAIEQAHVEIGDPGRADLSFLDQLRYRRPRVLDSRTRLVRPVELVKIDALDPEPAEGRLAFAPD